MKKLWNVLLAMSRTVLLGIVAFAVVASLMLYKLQSLTPSLSQPEIATLESASSFSAITDNMVNAPYKAAVFFATHVFDSAFGLRLVSAAIGILAVIIFYLIARRIYTGLIAAATTALFATSSLFLSVSRLGTPTVMLLSLLAIIGVGFYIRFGKRADIGWIVAAVVIGLSLYVPGMLFFILPAAMWQFRHAKKSFEQLKTPIIAIVSVVIGILCAPLIINLIREPELWRAYLGFSDTFAPVIEMLKYAGTGIMSLFISSPHDPVYWLGRQPVLDVFAGIMFIYGCYMLLRQYKLDRLWTLGGIFLITLLWIGLTTNRLGIVYVLPFVYLVIGFGLQRLINQWLSVFPKNPIARIVGSTLLAIAIVLSINFQTHRYYVAWPNNKTTKAVFSEPWPETR